MNAAADKTRKLLARMFPDTSAPPSELARARIALELAVEERQRLRRARMFDESRALHAKIVKMRGEVFLLSSSNQISKQE